mgnify:CR=1 FL=1
MYGVWYGWELEQPENVARIVFLPRNDDNFIREGEEYELFYWNHGTWMSLGRKTGNFEAVLKYDNVPAQALFRLHNRTKGSEEESSLTKTESKSGGNPLGIYTGILQKYPSSFRLYGNSLIILMLQAEGCFRYLSVTFHSVRQRLGNHSPEI